MSVYSSYCDCCWLGIEPGMGSDCPRCGYPINGEKEEAFLRVSLHDLGRVAFYGGANTTVTQLMDRYQRRLASLSQRAHEVFSPAMATSSAHVQSQPDASAGIQAEAHPMPLSIAPSGNMGTHNATPTIQPPQSVLSPKAFFADQSINIVASLGAFLILIGSLSFIATIPDLLSACIVLLTVHAIFGIIGATTYRFASLRAVSIVYTAIFALQVPLVGFSVYRLVAGSSFHLSASLLITLAAGYAMLAYGTLSIYQRFKLFGYLAAAALIVADLALAATLHLTVWWWPFTLLLLAFPLQLFVHRSVSQAFQTASSVLDVLREPAQVLLSICVVGGVAGVLYAALYALSVGSWVGVQSDLRFSIAATAMLLAAWLGFFVWHTRRYGFVRIAPYLGTACLLALCYALYASRPVYVVALTLLAALACGLARLDLRIFSHQASAVEQHLEILALLVIGALPFIAAPLVFLQLIGQVYFRQPLTRMPVFETALDVVILLLCCLLTLSVLTRHTGWRRILSAGEARWCGLLLLCGLLLNYALAIVLGTLYIAPVWTIWSFLVLCLGLAVCARRFLSASWAAPLDILVIWTFVETMLLGFGLNVRSSIILLLSLAVLFYGVAFYQRRWLLIPFALFCAFLALVHLFFSAAPSLLILAVLLPLMYVSVQRMLMYSAGLTRANVSGQQQLQQHMDVWGWPLLLVSIAYGVGAALYNSTHSAGIVQHWLAVPIPVALEIALVALTWYIGGGLAQKRSLAAIAVGFALWSILLVLPRAICHPLVYGGTYSIGCQNEGQYAFYSLAAIALPGALLGLLIDGIRRAVRGSTLEFFGHGFESWPWYLVSLEAIATLLVWSESVVLPVSDRLLILCILAFFSVVVMLIKRMPELLMLVTILAIRIILCISLLFWQQMIACSILCILLFAAQFIWRVLIPAPRRVAPARLSLVLALGGQVLVVLVIILAGGLFATVGVLVHVGAGSLIVLALLLLWEGYLQTGHTARWSCIYSAGLLCTLVVPWELAAFTQAQLSTLWLAPASYLIVISPFLARDEKLAQHQLAGQLSAIAGASLLLLPTLWLSFSQENLQPSLLLAGESLLLLLLGLVVHRRFFVLSSVGLIIITALHVLFLPSLGIPTFLALSLTGILLLALATILVLIRARLAAFWTKSE